MPSAADVAAAERLMATPTALAKWILEQARAAGHDETVTAVACLLAAQALLTPSLPGFEAPKAE